jgi:hypothetical protein
MEMLIRLLLALFVGLSTTKGVVAGQNFDVGNGLAIAVGLVVMCVFVCVILGLVAKRRSQ